MPRAVLKSKAIELAQRIIDDSSDFIDLTKEEKLMLARAIVGEVPPKNLIISQDVLARARRTKGEDQRQRAALAKTIFDFAKPAPGVVPKGTKLAMDNAPQIEVAGWAAQIGFNSAFQEGTTFLGYAYLAELAQRAEYRVMTEVIASEMTREWIDLKATGKDSKEERIKQLSDELKKLKIQQHFAKAAIHDGFFGRGHLYIDTGDTDDGDELKMPIGDGSSSLSKSKVNKDKPVLAVRNVEPVWTYPTSYNSNNPLKADWYKPDKWFVMGTELHASRLLTFIGREVPDLLKPAYSFGGLSMSQMAKPYVDNWLRTRQSVADIISAFSVMVLQTDLATSLQNGGDQIFARAELFNLLRNNKSLMMTDKNMEDFKNVSAPLGGLSELQAQTQEHLSSISRVPLVKLLGIQPAGLNACLVGDTLIETDDGFVAIKDVRPGQKVMTRKGWAPVAKAGCTAYTTELVEIKTSEHTLLCTANHPIWVPSINEFVSAGNVRPGQFLMCRGVIEKPNTENPSFGEDVFGGIEETATTQRVLVPESLFCFIEKSGVFIKGQFQQATTFTTETRIARIINWTISSCLAHPLMRSITVLRKGISFTKAANMNVRVATVVRNLLLGYQQRLSFAGIGADSRIDGKTNRPKLNRVLYAPALFVEQLLRRKGKTRNIVREGALPQAKIGVPIQSNITKSTQKNGMQHAKSGTPNAEKSVVVGVRRLSAQEFVYDIQVEKGYLPEFFANGICVHNSSEGEIRSFYDWIAAFQELLFRDNLQRVIYFVMLSLWGEIDPEITFEFKDLWQLDEVAKAALQKTKADTDMVYMEAGVVDSPTIRQRLIGDPESPYAGLDLELLPEPDMNVEGEFEIDPETGEEITTEPENGKIKDPSNRLANQVTNKAAEFGSPSTGGFSDK